MTTAVRLAAVRRGQNDVQRCATEKKREGKSIAISHLIADSVHAASKELVQVALHLGQVLGEGHVCELLE